jgi:hypothetical protein
LETPQPVFRLTPEQAARVLEAERAEKARLDAEAAANATKQKPAPVVAKQEKEMPVAPAPINVTAKSETFPAAPPSGLPASKEQRLNELLERYKADKITPSEYHQERAKILAE